MTDDSRSERLFSRDAEGRLSATSHRILYLLQLEDIAKNDVLIQSFYQCLGEDQTPTGLEEGEYSDQGYRGVNRIER